MKTFATNAEAVDFLKRAGIGTKCITQSTSQSAKLVKIALQKRGLKVRVVGAPRNWECELLEAYDVELSRKRKSYTLNYCSAIGESPKDAQGRSDHSHALGLKVGQSVIMQGASGSLRVWLKKHYGPWTCTLNKQSDGWLMTVRSEEPNPELIESFKPQPLPGTLSSRYQKRRRAKKRALKAGSATS